MRESLVKGEITFKKAEGIESRYKSIANIKKKNFERNLEKIEANI